ncbi:DUF6518 family protein [Catellatospora chokoriensis]|uniref:Uncharacterized protein n=1 Tax=Catellatospora chokoriensis TaxID=310353 RepID=A0A8J3K045_9ACTN|nr:DUF6518 family protein [Catellatospora chokoriensis]GIF90022.1 hypothetical protein Cch02nite_34660 [Catellatospora chokoriensis]
MNRRGWSLVVVAASVLALVSLASNVTTLSQLEGKADTLLAGRLTLSQLVNAGTVWAGLAVASGWLVRRPAPAAAAGVVALLTACVVHYGVGMAFGMFDLNVWTANLHWLLAAMVVGGPLGLVGAIARRSDPWGVAARLVVPVGAVLEPFIVGRFTTPAILPWPNRVADLITGLALLTAGVAGCFGVLAAGRRRPVIHERRATGVS